MSEKKDSDPPTYTEDVGKKSSNQAKGPGRDLDAKLDSENALPSELISAGSQDLHRKLGGKEIQLFAVGGAIGTCMEFVRHSMAGFSFELLHRQLNRATG
jgi:amino acid permease